MSLDHLRVRPGAKVDLGDFDSSDTGAFKRKEDADAASLADLDRLRDLQERLYADGRFAVLLVLQGMDTAGKDGMVRHLSGGVNLMGTEVTSFKAPTETELRHDFLWRIHQHTPLRGHMGIFNRSHYEDVLIVRVHDLVPKDVWQTRYDRINEFERLLTDGGTTVIKCFLHISEEEQKQRLQARLDDPEKLWKFNADDLKERAFWSQYRVAYEAALSKCSTEIAPWYVIPSDKKWYRNYAVTRVLVEALEKLDPQPPAPTVDPTAVVIA